MKSLNGRHRLNQLARMLHEVIRMAQDVNIVLRDLGRPVRLEIALRSLKYDFGHRRNLLSIVTGLAP
ncbi:hypothetical protein BHM03_00050282 [Ensete ventricosum]|nr:hypothetical protein BHM03_00050282 [Ensete ventricosum]